MLHLILGCQGSVDPGESPSSGTEPGDASDSGEVRTDCDGTQDGLWGHIYTDGDHSDRSALASGLTEPVDSPLDGEPVVLHDVMGVLTTTASCADGSWSLPMPDAGPYLVEAPFADCETRNCAPRLVEALAEGALNITVFGDSIPVVGGDVFPGQLQRLFDPLVPTQVDNAAIEGTTSAEWLQNFSRWVDVSDADVVIFSIGGNDLMDIDPQQALTDPEGAISAAFAVEAEVAARIEGIVDQIEAANPDAAIVFTTYIDYTPADTELWPILDLLFPDSDPMRDLTRALRDDVHADGRVLIGDLFERTLAMDSPREELLYDLLHVNSQGHQLYAEEIFTTLGGVYVGQTPLGSQDLGLQRRWSTRP